MTRNPPFYDHDRILRCAGNSLKRLEQENGVGVPETGFSWRTLESNRAQADIDRMAQKKP